MNASDLLPEERVRANEIFEQHYLKTRQRTDQIFAALMGLQWLAGIAAALWWTPYTWNGSRELVHPHVYAAVFLGGAIISLPILLAWLQPGRTVTRHIIAVGQMLDSALLIHLSGGRIETHFHIFGSLALLAFYRDWRVLLTASAVVAADHYIRGLWWPASVFGTDVVSSWRWAEHAAWVLFEDVFLFIAIRHTNIEARLMAEHQARLEHTNLAIEERVDERTEELLLAIGELKREVIRRQEVEHDLIAASRAAEQANRAKSTFLASMSHEIRTPMNGVIGMTSLLLETRLDREQRNFVETIRRSGDALLAIINDILDFSKIESGKLDLEKRPFDLHQTIEEALDILAPRAAEKGIDLAYLVEDTVPACVLGDVTRLRQILVNLVANGVKFTDQGEVVVTVSKHQAGTAQGLSPEVTLLFCVKDTGIGIPADKRPLLFQSFSQLDPSHTRKYGGTGLGLAICQRLTGLMGGKIWVESEEGCGSSFFFTIQTAGAPCERRPVTFSRHTPMTGKRLLIVDDGETNRRILKISAERWGMVPVEFSRPQDALEWARSGQVFDLAVLDMQMPDMDGIELATALKELPHCDGSPLVLLSSIVVSERRAERDHLFAATLTKPIKPATLYEILSQACHPDPESQRSPDPAAGSAKAKLAASLPLQILLAEDQVVNQMVALRILELLGYRADIAANGMEALQAISRQPYDVVFLDVNMPEMDGLEVARRLRSAPGASRPYLIAMTACALPEDRRLCLENGMDDYISKPIRPADIESVLRRMPRPVAAIP